MKYTKEDIINGNSAYENLYAPMLNVKLKKRKKNEERQEERQKYANERDAVQNKYDFRNTKNNTETADNTMSNYTPSVSPELLARNYDSNGNYIGQQRKEEVAVANRNQNQGVKNVQPFNILKDKNSSQDISPYLLAENYRQDANGNVIYDPSFSVSNGNKTQNIVYDPLEYQRGDLEFQLAKDLQDARNNNVNPTINTVVTPQEKRTQPTDANTNTAVNAQGASAPTDTKTVTPTNTNVDTNANAPQSSSLWNYISGLDTNKTRKNYKVGNKNSTQVTDTNLKYTDPQTEAYAQELDKVAEGFQYPDANGNPTYINPQSISDIFQLKEAVEKKKKREAYLNAIRGFSNVFNILSDMGVVSRGGNVVKIDRDKDIDASNAKMDKYDDDVAKAQGKLAEEAQKNQAEYLKAKKEAIKFKQDARQKITQTQSNSNYESGGIEDYSKPLGAYNKTSNSGSGSAKQVKTARIDFKKSKENNTIYGKDKNIEESAYNEMGNWLVNYVRNTDHTVDGKPLIDVIKDKYEALKKSGNLYKIVPTDSSDSVSNGYSDKDLARFLLSPDIFLDLPDEAKKNIYSRYNSIRDDDATRSFMRDQYFNYLGIKDETERKALEVITNYSGDLTPEQALNEEAYFASVNSNDTLYNLMIKRLSKMSSDELKAFSPLTNIVQKIVEYIIDKKESNGSITEDESTLRNKMTAQVYQTNETTFENQNTKWN